MEEGDYLGVPRRNSQAGCVRRSLIPLAHIQILICISKAHMESAHALDFVSLLLSRHTPRQAEITLSPYLKQNLPMGSLGAEVLQLHQGSEGEKVQDEKIPLGWKLNALASTADSLLRSASRLEQEIERETRYWEQVLTIKGQGWPICRLPRERHTLGVRFGFAEGDRIPRLLDTSLIFIAHSEFRDRGLAALRRDEDGNIQLDRGFASGGNRMLRVRVVQQQTQVLSSIKSSERGEDHLPVETLLLRARNSIYDEELYHELHREARILTNQGVRSNDGEISILHDYDKQIVIDLVPSQSDEDFQPENNLCAGIALSLRILLSHAHRQNLRRRIQPPPPLREGKMPRPTYAILAPVLEHVQHDLQLKSITRLLRDLDPICLKAGFELRFDKPSTPYGLVKSEAEGTQDGFHFTEKLINNLTKICHSCIEVHLPTGLTKLKIEIQTSLQPYISGTTYQCTIISCAPESFISRMQPVVHFSSFAALENHVLYLLKLDIIAVLASQPGIEKGWTIVSPHDAELRRVNKRTGRLDKIWILVQRNFIRLKWERGSKRCDEGLVTWDSKTLTADPERNRSLVNTIEEIFGIRP